MDEALQRWFGKLPEKTVKETEEALMGDPYVKSLLSIEEPYQTLLMKGIRGLSQEDKERIAGRLWRVANEAKAKAESLRKMSLEAEGEAHEAEILLLRFTDAATMQKVMG